MHDLCRPWVHPWRLSRNVHGVRPCLLQQEARSDPRSACEGILDLDTSNGRIEMESVTGVVDAQTSNGKITFSGTLIEGANHRMSTSNGRIDVTLLAAASLIIDARTSNASISTNMLLIGNTAGNKWNAVLNPPAAGTSILKTSNGEIGIHGI
ncbi:DUF4097 family beta strand repeat-containing protein [Candidatus Bipolaricaulota bacterium]